MGHHSMKPEDLLIDSFLQTHCRVPRRVTRNDGKSTYVRCDSKDPKICPSCARLRLVDQMRVIGSGCNVSGLDGVTAEEVGKYTYWFVTLTAPGFGPIHRVSDVGDVCKCKSVHEPDSDLRGVPVNMRTYRYRQQVAWNFTSNKLFKETTRRLHRRLPDSEWCFVREWQKRGALHFHGIVRVPAEYDHADTFTELAGLKTVTREGITWGRQHDVRKIEAKGTDINVRYMSKVVAYTSKQQSGDLGILSEQRRKHYDRLDWHARRMTCNKKGCAASKHCTGKAHQRFGFAGHLVTRSENWSLVGLTRNDLVEQRRRYAEDHASDEQRQLTLDLASKLRQKAIAADLARPDHELHAVKQEWSAQLLNEMSDSAHK